MTESESIAHQLAEWVAGRSWHNTVRDECCPDFSCCNSQVSTPLDVRQRFAAAPDQERNRMCFMFLGNAFSALNKNVYIAGDPDVESLEKTR